MYYTCAQSHWDLYPKIKVHPQNIIKFLPEHIKVSAKTVKFYQLLQEFLKRFPYLVVFCQLLPRVIRLWNQYLFS